MALRKLTPIDDAVYTIKSTIKDLKLERKSMDPDGNIRAGLEKLELGVNMIKARDLVGNSIKKLETELSSLARLLPPTKFDRSPVVLIDPFTDKPFRKKTQKRKRRNAS